MDKLINFSFYKSTLCKHVKLEPFFVCVCLFCVSWTLLGLSFLFVWPLYSFNFLDKRFVYTLKKANLKLLFSISKGSMIRMYLSVMKVKQRNL